MYEVVRTDPVETWSEPKRAGGVRLMARLSDRDARRWQVAGDRVVAPIERALGPEVLANRSASRRAWRPPQLSAALARAGRLATTLTRSRDALIRTDVADFYGSVTPSLLYRSLRRVGAGAREAALPAELVQGWGSGGCRGLPTGPSPSALMANAVLLPLDDALRPFGFARWVDDVLVPVPAGRVGEVLERIDEALSRLGLRRAEAKTTIGTDAIGWLGASLAVTDCT